MKKGSLLILLLVVIFSSQLNAQISTDIYDVQQNESLKSKNVMVIGIVTATTGIFDSQITYIEDEDGGPWSGVLIRDVSSNFFAVQGKKVRIIGKVVENYNCTEIQLQSYSIFNGNYQLPSPEVVLTNDIATDSEKAESYESVLIQIDSISVENDNLGYGEWLVNDSSGPCRVDDAADYLFYEVPPTETEISSITGILSYTYDDFKINPRYHTDIVENEISSAINIYSIQQDDRTIGKNVSVTGVVTSSTGIFDQQRTHIEEINGGPWSGISLWDSTATIDANKGDMISVNGKVVNNDGLTEIVVNNFNILSTNNILPAAYIINTNDISSISLKAEIFESVLCELNEVYVTNDNAGNGDWIVDDGSGECRIGDNSNIFVYNVPPVGTHLSTITGIVNYESENFKLDPRTYDDIFETSSTPIGDTLTIIQRPIQTIPAILRVGDTLTIECKADPGTSLWEVELLHGQLHVPLEVTKAEYDPATFWWNILVIIPDVPVFDLYNLKVKIDSELNDISKNAVSVIDEFKDDYYFIHITDTHLPTTMYVNEEGSELDSSSMVDLREVINDINIINPEFVLLTGDLIHEGELEEYQFRRYFTRSKRILSEFSVPLYLTAGNHDIGGWSSTPPSDGTARRSWWQFFGWKRLNDPPPAIPWYTQNYSFDYGPVHYVGLEAYNNYDWWRSGIYGSTSFTSKQIQWLNDNLASASQSTSQVLFYHFDFKEELDLDALGVEMAIWGHNHQNTGDIYGGPPYNISTSAACNGNRTYRLVRVSNGVIQPSETISSGWNMDNLNVNFQPANDGTNTMVTANIKNENNEQFEHSLLHFYMPLSDDEINVTGGSLLQVKKTDTHAICYVKVDIQPVSSQSVTIGLFSGPFSKNCSINKKYINPGMDSLHIKTEVVNPENREITVNAIVESFDHSIADTLSMYDDGNHNDGEADDGIYGSFWNGTSDENFYNIHIETISVESGNSDINEDANYFTTVGPVKYNNSVIAQKRGNTHRMRLYLKNEGLVASAPNVNVEMSIADSSIIIGDNYRYFGNIDPGQTAQSNSFYSIEAENPPNSVVAQMQIFSNDKLFWTDTFNLVFNDTEISNPEHSGPKEFALKQNFPNPFNPTTTFEYEIPTESNVIITIYDLNGRIIDTLVNRRHEPGYYSMQWNADGVGSGIYLYKMEANNFVEMKKLSVIK